MQVDAEDNGKELMKKLGHEWNTMSDKQKAPFVQMKDAQKVWTCLCLASCASL